MPFYIFLALNIAGLIFGVHRYQTQPTGQGAIAFVMFWAVLDLALLLSALGVMLEKRQLRQEPRVPHREKVSLEIDAEHVVEGMTKNASNTGARLVLNCSKQQRAMLKTNELIGIYFHERHVRLYARVIAHKGLSSNQVELGLLYRLSTVQEERDAIDIAFGSSRQLALNNQRRHQGRSVAHGLMNILRFGLNYGSEHLRFLLMMVSKRIYRSKA